MNKDVSIGKWISVLHRYTQIHLSKELKPYNLGSGQHRFLLVLFHEDGISQEMLSSILLIDKATTARAISKLEKEGYVFRQVDPNDKRSYRVFITDKAKEFKPILKNILDNWSHQLANNFSEEEKEQLLDLLSKMSKNAAKHQLC